MTGLEYPFSPEDILGNHLALKAELLAGGPFLDKRIAVLGGSTTNAIVDMLELFLLHRGIRPTFYQSEYAQYWQDAMFGEELRAFTPDLVFVHTTVRNLQDKPAAADSPEQVEEKFARQMGHFTAMWQALEEAFHCPVIQNNFERPPYRLLGNSDISDIHGFSHFVARLNGRFTEYARSHPHFYIHDIDYLAAETGLAEWHSNTYWYRYKYALSMRAIPRFAHNLANMVQSIYGRGKKALVLDLDNTLWGGVVGDDGVQALKLGPEMPLGQAFSDFQAYVKELADRGVLLAVCSKNDEQNALDGLRHPYSLLPPEAFAALKANWDNKDENVRQIAKELNIGLDSLVFVDDNPAERAMVAGQLPQVAVPEIGKPEQYISVLDGSGFFEATALTADDLARGQMYKENAQRAAQQAQFESYADFLESLQMTAEIRPFEPMHFARIAQLVNKSNQFNLTTRRYSEAEIEQLAAAPDHLCLYGRLKDRFGDNGVVSVVIGRAQGDELHIDLWVMSCRVLKREMEYAMFDALVAGCEARGIGRIVGYYYPTQKNSMVAGFYADLGFAPGSEDQAGNTVWHYEVAGHTKRNSAIQVDGAAGEA